MNKKNIILIGFMGSGKSKVAKILGKIMGIRIISTDDRIEQREGRSIAEIFTRLGEPYFRQVERQVVAEASKEKGVIIDCGGGVVVDPKNLKDLKRNGITIYLSASAEFLYAQVKKTKNRPLLNVDDPLQKIKDLLKTRTPQYEKADIHIVSENKTVDQIAKEIVKVLSK